MSLDEVKTVMNKVCPNMLSNDNFMKNTVERYCNGEATNPKELSKEEFKTWITLNEIIATATVGQLIDYLKNNFKEDDKLCYMDCIEGYKNDCTYVKKEQLGQRFFYYVKELKDRFKEDGVIDDIADNQYEFVNDNDVVVI